MLFASDSFSKIKLCVLSFGWPFNGVKTIGKFSSGLPCTYVHLHFFVSIGPEKPHWGSGQVMYVCKMAAVVFDSDRSRRFYLQCFTDNNFWTLITGRLTGWPLTRGFAVIVVKYRIFFQVLSVIRSNYDTLTLKLQENLDHYEKYSEKPKEAAYFTQLVCVNL